MTVLTAFTVLAGKEFMRAAARVRMILEIFLTYSSVLAVIIVVALEFCNISVFHYYSISVQIKYNVQYGIISIAILIQVIPINIIQKVCEFL